MRAHGADAAVVVAYGLILPKTILAAFPLGAFNLHASLLPRWRGAAPIHRAVMAGDTDLHFHLLKAVPAHGRGRQQQFQAARRSDGAAVAHALAKLISRCRSLYRSVRETIVRLSFIFNASLLSKDVRSWASDRADAQSFLVPFRLAQTLLKPLASPVET